MRKMDNIDLAKLSEEAESQIGAMLDELENASELASVSSARWPDRFIHASKAPKTRPR